MKKLSQLLHEVMLGLERIYHAQSSASKKVNATRDFSKTFFTSPTQNDNAAQSTDKQRELLYQFLHFQRENNHN